MLWTSRQKKKKKNFFLIFFMTGQHCNKKIWEYKKVTVTQPLNQWHWQSLCGPSICRKPGYKCKLMYYILINLFSLISPTHRTFALQQTLPLLSKKAFFCDSGLWRTLGFCRNLTAVTTWPKHKMKLQLMNTKWYDPKYKHYIHNSKSGTSSFN